MRIYTIILTLILNFATSASLLAYLAGLSFAQYFLAMKDLFLFAGLLVVMPSLFLRIMQLRLEKLDWLILLTVVVNFVSYALSDAPVSDRLLNLRRNLSFLFVLLIFREYGTGFMSEKNYFVFLKPILIILLGFGIFEYFMPDAFWNDVMSITGYWALLSVDPFNASAIGESGRFYSWDLHALIGEVRRMVSLYFEPTTLAAFFVSCICMSFIGGARERPWTLLITVLGLLTISKFFVISIFLAFAVIALRDRLKSHMFFSFVIATLLASSVIIAIDIDAGALAHLRGVSSLVEIAMQNKLLGLGLGAGGNYADPELETADIGAESGFGNIVAQLGVMAFVYLFLLNWLYVTLLEAYRRTKDLRYTAAIAALICWTFSFFLSASSLGLSGNAFIFILIGSVLHRDIIERRGQMRDRSVV